MSAVPVQEVSIPGHSDQLVQHGLTDYGVQGEALSQKTGLWRWLSGQEH